MQERRLEPFWNDYKIEALERWGNLKKPSNGKILNIKKESSKALSCNSAMNLNLYAVAAAASGAAISSSETIFSPLGFADTSRSTNSMIAIGALSP